MYYICAGLMLRMIPTDCLTVPVRDYIGDFLKPQLWGVLALTTMNRIQKRREKLISLVLRSGVIRPGSEPETIINYVESLTKYIDSGEYDFSKCLPNGYQWVKPPKR